MNAETTAHRQFNRPKKEFEDISQSAGALFNLNKDVGFGLRAGSEDEGLTAENSVEIGGICPWTNRRQPNCDTNAR